MYCSLLVFTILSIGLTLLNCVFYIGSETQFLSILYTFLLLGGYLIILRLYIYFRIRVYKMMRLKHQRAHKTHKVTALVLLILTTYCVLIKIFFQFGFLFWRVCVGSQLKQCFAVRPYYPKTDCEHLFKRSDRLWISDQSWCHNIYEFMNGYT